MTPVVVGDNFIIQGENSPFGVHHWIPLQLQAGISYAAHGLFSTEVIVHPGSPADLGFSTSYTLYTREFFISLRDSQGQLVPGKTSGRDFAFSTPNKGVYYLDVVGPYPGFGPDDSLIETAKINFASYQDDYVDNTATKGQMAKPAVQAVTVKGSVEVDGDHDWFKVSLDAGKQVLFSVKPTNTSPASLEHPVIHLYDSTGKVLSTGDDSQQISFTATKSGNYYVDVSGWVSSISRNFGSDNGTYTLTATPKADDYGNTPLTAGSIDFGTTGEISGNIETKGDHDWVAVKLLAGRSYFFSLSGAGSAKPVAGQLNTVALALRDAKGVLIDQGEGAGGYTSKLVYMPEKSATYYLDASALKNTETGHYTLNELSYLDDAPNYVSNIKPLEPGVTLGGNIGYKGDHDFLSVKVEAGKAYQISISPIFVDYASYKVDLEVKLRDAAGALITTGNIVKKYESVLVDL
ncbi:hypothetical protein CRENPOLYSF2_3320001 [Crenothrix polyspora]|uniref:Peptidase C-terminal archaeal/bacterial domain-containing protein n=2 Tax=Crenothrix polyspora TaxID=360316 RepID=A0A1R4HB20_9GAMM|nr:hypothetical protein CRENPOLYSF2_3320001 [Crenothrix polyspora]